MTTMNTSKLCQKQQKERACRQRIVVMPLDGSRMRFPDAVGEFDSVKAAYS